MQGQKNTGAQNWHLTDGERESPYLCMPDLHGLSSGTQSHTHLDDTDFYLLSQWQVEPPDLRI